MLRSKNQYGYRRSCDGIVSTFSSRLTENGSDGIIGFIRKRIDELQSAFYNGSDPEVDTSDDSTEEFPDIIEESVCSSDCKADGYTDNFLLCLNEFLKNGDFTVFRSCVSGLREQKRIACQTGTTDNEDTCRVEILTMRKKDMVCPHCGNINHYDYCVYCLRPIIPAKRHRKGEDGRYRDMCRSDIKDVAYTVCDPGLKA